LCMRSTETQFACDGWSHSTLSSTRRWPTLSTSGQVRRTRKRSVISDSWDVVVVPFPFTDRPITKRRPALTISTRTFNSRGHSILAMITSKADPEWPGDTALRDHQTAGLPLRSLVRLKIFTLDNRLIVKIAGKLSEVDRKRVTAQLRKHLSLADH
jgi:mRNA interferase MazF